MPEQLKFYFTFRSPFAYVALHRIRRLKEFQDVDIELIPVSPDNIFGGHFDNPTDNIFKVTYVFEDAARQMEEAGIDASYLKDRVGKMGEMARGFSSEALKAGKVGMTAKPYTCVFLFLCMFMQTMHVYTNKIGSM